jgi:hypothetical protein
MKILIYNALTGKETEADCESIMHHILTFTFGENYRLSAERDGPCNTVIRNILNKHDCIMGQVAWL